MLNKAGRPHAPDCGNSQGKIIHRLSVIQVSHSSPPLDSDTDTYSLSATNTFFLQAHKLSGRLPAAQAGRGEANAQPFGNRLARRRFLQRAALPLLWLLRDLKFSGD